MESTFATHWAMFRHPSLQQFCLSPSRQLGGLLANKYPGSLLLDLPQRATLCVPRKANPPAKLFRGRTVPTQAQYVRQTWKVGARGRPRYRGMSRTSRRRRHRHRQPAQSGPSLPGESRTMGLWACQDSLTTWPFPKVRDNHWRFSRVDRNARAHRVCLVKVPHWFVILPHKWEKSS